MTDRQMTRAVYDVLSREFGKIDEAQLVAWMKIRGWTLNSEKAWIKPYGNESYETTDLELNVILGLMEAFEYRTIQTKQPTINVVRGPKDA